jgi:hypothetical protein
MSNNRGRRSILHSFVFNSSTKIHIPDLHHFGFTSRVKPLVVLRARHLSPVHQTSTMAHKEEVSIFLNVADTLTALIDLINICEVDDGTTITMLYSLVTTFCTLIAKCVIKDIMFDHPALTAIIDALLVQDKFCIVRYNEVKAAPPPENCNRQSAFKWMLKTLVAANRTFKVGVQIFGTVLTSLGLSPRSQVPRTASHLPPPRRLAWLPTCHCLFQHRTNYRSKKT